MNEQTAVELREQQLCPDWCQPSDHTATAVEFDSEPEHFALIADGRTWCVEMVRPIPGGDISIRLLVDSEFQRVLMPIGVGRSVAAAIVRACDLAESDGCSR